MAIALAACAGAAQGGQGGGSVQADVREVRARAIIAALSTGDAATFEAAARENYSAALYARRSAEQRAEFVAAISADFSAMQIVSLTEEAGVLTVAVRGSGETTGRFGFSYEDAPEHRIARIDIEAEMGGGADEQRDGPRVPPPPINATMPASEMGAALDQWIAPFVQHDDFAGVVLIANEGQPFVARVYGPADRERNVAANETTAYNIASIGKKFTQTAIAQLIQEGRLSLSTTIGDVLPDYPNVEARTATISQLVGMRGGMSDFFGPDFERQPKDRFNSNHAYYEYVSRLPQRFAPGTRSEYCNGCYVVLGEMVERVSGMRFEDYIQRFVFTPAGMTRTGYFNSSNLPDNVARPYMRTDGPGSAYVNALEGHGASGSGAGGAYSTARDLLAFDNALREGRLLGPEMTAWVLGGQGQNAARNTTPLAIAGGGGGSSNILESNGHWAVIVTGNVQEPLPEQLGLALARQLSR